MANRGAVTATLNSGGSYTIPTGYHNGSGKITVNSLASQTPATATPDKILVGYTAWVNGQIITGTNKGYDVGYQEGYNKGHSDGYNKGKNEGSGIIMTNLWANASSGHGQNDAAVYMDYTFDVSKYKTFKLTGIIQKYNYSAIFKITADGVVIHNGAKSNDVSWDYVLDVTNYSNINVYAYCYDSGSYTRSEIKKTITKLEIY